MSLNCEFISYTFSIYFILFLHPIWIRIHNTGVQPKKSAVTTLLIPVIVSVTVIALKDINITIGSGTDDWSEAKVPGLVSWGNAGSL